MPGGVLFRSRPRLQQGFDARRGRQCAGRQLPTDRERDIFGCEFRLMLLRFLISMKPYGLYLCGFLFAVCLAEGHPDLDENLKVIPLQNGVNAVDLDGAGTPAVIVLARRDNFNAHSFEVTTIYATLKTSGEDVSEWKIIPAMPKTGKEQLQLVTSGGADCVLHDFRLLTDNVHHSAVLIVADRKFGKNFADKQPVTFDLYRLTRNQQELPGAPALYFKFEKQWKSGKSYADVNDAFQAELGIASGRTPGK